LIILQNNLRLLRVFRNPLVAWDDGNHATWRCCGYVTKMHHIKLLGLGGGHHLPPYSILCAFPRGPHPNGILSQDSQMGVPKFPKLGFLQLWRRITLCANFRWRWGLKQSCNIHQEISNSMSHATCTEGNWVNSWLLVVGSQIVKLTSGLSFGHNLCFRCPNGSCKPILDIYIMRSFLWYKKLFNPMGFDPWNHSLKIQKSTGTPTPKMGIHLEMWVLIFTPSHTLGLPSWHVPLQALVLIASPRLRLRHLLEV
jgi:hypothetical protein